MFSRFLGLFAVTLILTTPILVLADDSHPEILTILPAATASDTTETQPCPDPAAPDTTIEHKSALFPYEATTISMAHEGNEWFLDYQMSFQFGVSESINGFLGSHPKLQFDSVRAAMTLRGGFYAFGRHSSPVIGKRFNPKVFARSNFWETGFIDVGFCHESNGQTISSEKVLNAAMDDAESHEDPRETAHDLISRSWNFFEVKIGASKLWDRKSYAELTIADPFAGSIGFGRRVLPRWERVLLNKTHRNKRNITSRAQVHGVTLLVGRESEEGHEFSFDVELKTGTQRLRRPISSVKIGVSFVICESIPLPIYVHYFNGFASDLAEFYRDSASFGIGLRFKAHHTRHESEYAKAKKENEG